MEENKMKIEGMSNKGKLEGLIGFAFGTVMTSIIAFGVGKTLINNAMNKCAQRAAMTHYQPVGNGGALATWYGKISQERQEMYKRMLKAYEDVAGENSQGSIEHHSLKAYASEGEN